MYQSWSWLSFLHWPYDPAVVQRLLPNSLEVQTFQGQACGRPDGREGLWFFSLDAARLEPVLVARSTYALPYMWSAMTVERDGPVIRYLSRRR